ncbi:MAG: MFS transporter [Bacteroidota bacterium]|nr:MFS transporter [Bacteroidota bacterium]
MNITTFNAFKSRNYRLYFVGQSISLIGTWMQKTAVSWVVYSLTHSKFMLGVSAFATLFPSFLFSFLGGVVSDRYNKYKVLLTTQVISMIQAVLLTLVVFSNHYTVAEILALGALLGIVNAFDVPARQSLVYDMVDDKKDLPNAVALNSSMVNLSRLIGPGIAGIAIEKLGDTICFGMNAISFIAVIISLLMMRLPAYVAKPRTKNIMGDLREGLEYVRRNKNLTFIFYMIGIMSLFVLPYNTLMPVYAKDIFKGTASTFGVIDSVIGLGAFIGAIYLASQKKEANLHYILARNTFIFGTGLILFSHTHLYWLALFFILISAFGMMAQIAVSNTMVQTTVASAMRGRVISFFTTILFGLQPLGGLLVGFASEHIGVQNTVLCEGVIALVVGMFHFRFLHRKKSDKNKPEVAQPEIVRAALEVT